MAIVGLMALPVLAANGTWNSNASANWSDTSRWAGGVVANGVDATATFGSVISRNRTIRLNTSRTIGGISAQDTSHNYTITGSNTLTLDVTTGIPTLDVVSGRTLRINPVIAGTDGLAKVGAGTLRLTGTNTYSGGTTLSAGTIRVDSTSALGSTSGALTVHGGTVDLRRNISVGNVTGTGGAIRRNAGSGTRTLTIGSGNTGGGDFQGIIENGSGNLALTKTGTGTITLSGSNVYTGTTRINAGTLQIGNGGSTGSLSPSSSIVNNGTLTFNRVNTITQGTNFASVISGSGGVTQLGAGTLILSGTNTYTGPTLIANGTLAVTGSGSINASSGITIGAGARLAVNSSTVLALAPGLSGAGVSNRAVLGGTGTISGALTLDDLGDVLSPGNSPGILSFDVNQSWSSYSYEWEVNDWTTAVAGTNFDRIDITGGLTLTGAAAGSYVLDVLSLTSGNVPGDVANFAETDNAWTILATSSGISGFNAAFWTIDTGGFTNTFDGTWSLSLANSNRDLVLAYTATHPVPEPGTVALLVFGGLALLALRRHLGAFPRGADGL